MGVGHLGKIHAKCIALAEGTTLTGFYDTDPDNAAFAENELGIKRFHSLDALLDASDAVDIVTPTTTHHALAKEAIMRGKHVFVEKPITSTLAEAEELLAVAAANKVAVQVGHVERFNPAFLALDGFAPDPMFIEAHRLATFNPRGTDVSVVLDLMIHDLDIVLSLVKSEITEIRARGVALVSPTPDIANARIEFENGCVANLTASRISLKQMRKVRFFQKDAYVSLDFLEKSAQIVRLFESAVPNALELETALGKKFIHVDMPEISPVNAIKMELEAFAKSVREGSRPIVSIEDGYKALKVAHLILEEINIEK